MVQTAQARRETGAAASLGPGSSQALEIGSHVSCCASFDKQYHPAEIIERRTNRDGSESIYVHYAEFDKRLDEWVPLDRVLRGGAAGGATRGERGASASPASPSPASLAGAGAGSPAGARVGASGAATGLGGAGSPTVPGAGAGGGGGGVGAALAASRLGSEPKLTRRLKRQHAELNHVTTPVEDLPPLDRRAERAHAERTRVRNVHRVQLGRYELDAWYYSPYPEPYGRCEELFVCEFSLKYFRKASSLARHSARLALRRPPGDEIYRSPPEGPARGDPPLSMFEVDGAREKVYCQNLCLLSKLFLDHKTLYYDVDPFLFYVLCEHDAAGHHVVGYFSKEKASPEGNNLACILTLPPWQRRGYGRFLIAFSYELSKLEGKVGSPERPLSDLGAVSYRSYWTRVILEALRDSRRKGQASLEDVSRATAIRPEDVVRTLESLGLVKYWKGDHIVSVTQRVVEDHLRAISHQRTVTVDASRIRWVPYQAGPGARASR